MSTAPVLEDCANVHTAPADARFAALAQAIHVWQWPVLLPEEEGDKLRSLLAAEELARADRFHFREDRAAYLLNRGRLRLLLAHYLDCPARELVFSYGPQGKPLLAGAGRKMLEFNLSHTRGLAVAAVTRGRRVGVDVEKVVDAADLLSLAREQFSTHEYRHLSACGSAEQATAFYACWTRKEAFLKGLGDGLDRDLSAFEVSVRAGVPAALLCCAWNPALCQSWQIHSLEPSPGYAGALAYEGTLPLPSHAIQIFPDTVRSPWHL